MANLVIGDAEFHNRLMVALWGPRFQRDFDSYVGGEIDLNESITQDIYLVKWPANDNALGKPGVA